MNVYKLYVFDDRTIDENELKQLSEKYNLQGARFGDLIYGIDPFSVPVADKIQPQDMPADIKSNRATPKEYQSSEVASPLLPPPSPPLPLSGGGPPPPPPPPFTGKVPPPPPPFRRTEKNNKDQIAKKYFNNKSKILPIERIKTWKLALGDYQDNTFFIEVLDVKHNANLDDIITKNAVIKDDLIKILNNVSLNRMFMYLSSVVKADKDFVQNKGQLMNSDPELFLVYISFWLNKWPDIYKEIPIIQQYEKLKNSSWCSMFNIVKAIVADEFVSKSKGQNDKYAANGAEKLDIVPITLQNDDFNILKAQQDAELQTYCYLISQADGTILSDVRSKLYMHIVDKYNAIDPLDTADIIQTKQDTIKTFKRQSQYSIDMCIGNVSTTSQIDADKDIYTNLGIKQNKTLLKLLKDDKIKERLQKIWQPVTKELDLQQNMTLEELKNATDLKKVQSTLDRGIRNLDTKLTKHTKSKHFQAFITKVKKYEKLPENFYTELMEALGTSSSGSNNSTPNENLLKDELSKYDLILLKVDKNQFGRWDLWKVTFRTTTVDKTRQKIKSHIENQQRLRKKWAQLTAAPSTPTLKDKRELSMIENILEIYKSPQFVQMASKFFKNENLFYKWLDVNEQPYSCLYPNLDLLKNTDPKLASINILYDINESRKILQYTPISRDGTDFENITKVYNECSAFTIDNENPDKDKFIKLINKIDDFNKEQILLLTKSIVESLKKKLQLDETAIYALETKGDIPAGVHNILHSDPIHKQLKHLKDVKNGTVLFYFETQYENLRSLANNKQNITDAVYRFAMEAYIMAVWSNALNLIDDLIKQKEISLKLEWYKQDALNV